jgi:hypothetical protein
MVGLLSERINGSMHRFEKAGTRSPIIGTYLTNESRHRDRKIVSIPSNPIPTVATTAAVKGNKAKKGTEKTVKVTYHIPNALHLTATHT